MVATYTTIANGVDRRMTIIMHTDTGFYNLTKTSTLFQRLKQEDEAAEAGLNAGNRADGNSHQPSKRGKLIADWFRNRDTNEKLAECARLNGIAVEACSFIINDGDNAHTGTYIHPDLYDHFVMWLSPKYSMRVSKMLRQHHDAANLKIIGEKDDKIDELTQTVNRIEALNLTQAAQMTELRTINLDQTERIDRLLGHAVQQEESIEDLKARFDLCFDFISSMARLTLPMWIGSSVFKTQLDHLIRNKTLTYALTHLKVMYVVALYQPPTDLPTQAVSLEVYFCCTNFADVSKRLRTLYSRHCEGDTPMVMLKPEAVCLISQEINCELAKLRQMVFGNQQVHVEFSNRRKAYQVTMPLTAATIEAVGEGAQDRLNKIVATVRGESFQGYQMRRDQTLQDDEYDVNEKIIEHFRQTDTTFFQSTLPNCQEFIECYVTRDAATTNGYRPTKVSRATTHRADLDQYLPDHLYPLHKINTILSQDNGVSEVDRMIQNGTLSRTNLKAWFRASHAAANVEGVDEEVRNRFEEVAAQVEDLTDSDDEAAGEDEMPSTDVDELDSDDE